MEDGICRIFQILSKHAFVGLEDEKKLQVSIMEVLSGAVKVKREYRLSSTDIIDFYIPELLLGIEVKVKGKPKQIYKQLERYSNHDEVKHLILLTAKTMGLPSKINDKPTYYISLGQAYL